jgi:hypothetical protein
MKHAWRVGFFLPDNVKHSGDLGLSVRKILKYTLAICEKDNMH